MKRRVVIAAEAWPDLVLFPQAVQLIRYAPIPMGTRHGPILEPRLTARAGRTDPDALTNLEVTCRGNLGDLRPAISQGLLIFNTLALNAFDDPTVLGSAFTVPDANIIADYPTLVVDLAQSAVNLEVFTLMVDMSWEQEDGPLVSPAGPAVTFDWPDPLADDFAALNAPVVAQWQIGSTPLSDAEAAAAAAGPSPTVISAQGRPTALGARLVGVGGAPAAWGCILFQLDYFDPSNDGWAYSGCWGLVPAGAQRIPADYFDAALLATLGTCAPWAMWPEALWTGGCSIAPSRLIRLRATDISGVTAAGGASATIQLLLG